MTYVVTEKQALEAVDLILKLAEAAENGGDIASELRVGRPVIDEILRLKNALVEEADFIEQMQAEQHEAELYEAEQRELENREMEEHFRKHPNG